MFKKLYLPIGMLVVLAVSLLYPAAGVWIKPLKLNNLFIVLIFLICGWQTDVKGLRWDKKFAMLFICGAAVSLIAAPWLALGISKLLRLSALPIVGLVVISAVPPTLSSGIVMTENAGGNTFLSMTLTIGYNLLGVLTLPLVLPWCLTGSGAIDTNPLRMLINLALLVVLPFLAGFLGKKISRRRLPSWCGYLPSSCVLLLLLSFFSNSSGDLKNYPVNMLLLAGLGGILMHGILLAAMWYGGRALRFSVFDCKALIFTAASKTITIALTTLAILGADDGAAVTPCLIYYFLQMMVDAAIAGKMGISAEKTV